MANTSELVSTQLPEHIASNDAYSQFVELLVCYYKFLEQEGQSTYYVDRLANFIDIDTIDEEYIENVLQSLAYGAELSENSYTNRLFVRLFRQYVQNKGTDASISFLFRVLYGERASVSYPKDLVFRLSDGSWREYSFFRLDDDHETLVNASSGLEITGSSSGSKAVVDSYITRGEHIDVVVEDITGEFLLNDTLTIQESNTEITPVRQINKINITNGGYYYGVGEDVSVTDVTEFNGEVGAIAPVPYEEWDGQAYREGQYVEFDDAIYNVISDINEASVPSKNKANWKKIEPIVWGTTSTAYPNTAYEANTYVSFQGNVYYAENGVSYEPPAPDWTSATAYAVNDRVKYGNEIYSCLVARTTSHTDNPADDGTGWEVLSHNFKQDILGWDEIDEWMSGRFYSPGDVIKHDINDVPYVLEEGVPTSIAPFHNLIRFTDATHIQLQFEDDDYVNETNRRRFQGATLTIFNDTDSVTFTVDVAFMGGSTAPQGYYLTGTYSDGGPTTVSGNNILIRIGTTSDYRLFRCIRGTSSGIDSRLPNIDMLHWESATLPTWNSHRTYNENDYVTQDDVSYCRTEYQSKYLFEDPTEDTANWTNITTLSDKWKNEWNGSPYYRGDIVRYEDEYYTALNPVSWASGTDYSADDLVTYQNLLYQRNNIPISNTITPLVGAGIEAWESGKHYVENEHVKYHNRVYRRNATSVSDLTWNPETAAPEWEPGMYAVNDPVSIISDEEDVTTKIYMCIVARTPEDTDSPEIDTASWREAVPWVSRTASYTSSPAIQQDFVIYQNNVYRVTTRYMDGTWRPDTTSWPIVFNNVYNMGWDEILTWTNLREYEINDEVLYQGKIYDAGTLHRRNAPTWQIGTYRIRDVVRYNNAYYACLRARTETNTDTPADDTTGWFAIGAWQPSGSYSRHNFVTYNDGIYRRNNEPDDNTNPQDGDNWEYEYTTTIEQNPTIDPHWRIDGILSGAGWNKILNKSIPASNPDPDVYRLGSDVQEFPNRFNRTTSQPPGNNTIIIGATTITSHFAPDATYINAKRYLTAGKTLELYNDTSSAFFNITGVTPDDSTGIFVLQGSFVSGSETTVTGNNIYLRAGNTSNILNTEHWNRIINIVPRWEIGDYAVGDIVFHDSVFYTCAVARTGIHVTNPSVDTTGWTARTTYEAPLYAMEWNAGTFSEDDVVFYNSLFYICTEDRDASHTNPPSEDTTGWRIYKGSIESVSISNGGNGETPGAVSIAGDYGAEFAPITDSDLTILSQSSGFYENSKGRLSGNMRVHDSFFYQDYSQIITSGIATNRYENTVKNLFHPAGTIAFGGVRILTAVGEASGVSALEIRFRENLSTRVPSYRSYSLIMQNGEVTGVKLTGFTNADTVYAGNTGYEQMNISDILTESLSSLADQPIRSFNSLTFSPYPVTSDAETYTDTENPSITRRILIA